MNTSPEPTAASPLKLDSTATIERTANLRVLVVEKDAAVRHLIQVALRRRFGCDIDLAPSGREAVIRLMSGEYALVICDLMSQAGGMALHRWMRTMQPAMIDRVVLTTGYSREHRFDREIAEWRIPLLPKPFPVSVLYRMCAPFLGV